MADNMNPEIPKTGNPKNNGPFSDIIIREEPISRADIMRLKEILLLDLFIVVVKFLRPLCSKAIFK